MHSWKKKLVVSQLALACTLAITSQANAANYDTWGYHDNTTTDLVWPYDTDNDGIADAGGMDPMGSDGNYVTYNGLFTITMPMVISTPSLKAILLTVPFLLIT